MDANDLAAFRNTRRNRRTAWGPKSAVYPINGSRRQSPGKGQPTEIAERIGRIQQLSAP